jgi:hypothetical protein
MTDPTAPVTPRTNCFNCGTPYGGVHPSHKRLVRDGVIEPCIEREAGSTDALRMDDDHEPHPCCRHPRCCPHALAASDAGTATRSYIGRVRDTEERLIAESLRTDAGPAGIDVERLADFIRDKIESEPYQGLHPELASMGLAIAIRDEFLATPNARLSREFDR